jgi:serine protease AprX
VGQTPELCVTQIFSGGAELSLCGDPPFHATPNDVGNTQLLAVDGPDVLVVLWEEQTSEGVRPFYAVTRDGETFPIVRSTSYDLRMKYATFDPGVESLNVEAELMADESCNLHVVQFVAPSMPEFRDAVSAAGGVIRGFLPNHSHLVEMDAAAKAQVEALAWVRAVTPYHPAYRLESYLRENLADAENLFPLQRYNIMVAERGLDQKNAVADRITQLGGTINKLMPGGFLLEATLTPEQLVTVASYNEVVYVDRWSEPEEDMDIAREISGANYVAEIPIPGYTGQGVRGEVIDSGLYVEHNAFQPLLLTVRGPNSSDRAHGTAVYGIIFGDGTFAPIDHPKLPPPRGVMPDGKGIFSTYTDLLENVNNDEYCHVCETVSSDCAQWCLSPDPIRRGKRLPHELGIQTYLQSRRVGDLGNTDNDDNNRVQPPIRTYGRIHDIQ